MKRTTTFLICLMLGTSLAQSQDYRDKAAEEKAEMDKQAQLKEQRNKNWNGNEKNSIDKNQYRSQSPQNNDAYNKPGAAAQFIPCPVTQIEARVTSSIPSDWWDTPQQGNLQNTRVTDVGGQPTLQCLYWAYGTEIPLMKRAPAGLRCVAQSNGFRCE